MSQITSSSDETRFWPSVKQAFVQDAITDAAVDQLAFDLAANNLIDLFARAFHPDANSIEGLASSADESASLLLPPREKLTPLLEQFVENLQAVDRRTRISNLKPDTAPHVFEIAKLYATHVYEATVDVRDTQRARKYDPPKARETSYLDISTTLEQLQMKGIPSTVANLESKTEQVLRLTRALRHAESDSAIICGGSVPIELLESPLILRFDKGTSGQSKVNLHTADQDLYLQIESLVSQCQEATFGVGGRDILDKEYRKALKLDPADFSINFHPFDHGIADIINDLLLPNRATSGLRMQLYKLNIYEAGGKFKSHVDTPRSLNQFGSLVVCLPSMHTGGELVVRHQGRTATYEWGNSTTALAWAAFYSDCEHEVLEVTSGFRITLTYNLYWLPLREPRADAPLSILQVPLFKEVQEALRDPHFLPRGGVIGFHCGHLYPRNRQDSQEGIPYCLKGVDRLLWMVLQGLSIRQGVHLVFDKAQVYNDLSEVYENGYMPSKEYFWTIGRPEDDPEDDDGSEVVILSEKNGMNIEANQADERPMTEMYRDQVVDQGRPPALTYDSSDPPMLPQSTFEKRLDQLLDSRTIRGMKLEKVKSEYPGLDRVSNVFEPTRASGDEQGEEKAAILDEFSSEIKGIRWLNDQRNMEMALAYIAVTVKAFEWMPKLTQVSQYGNQAELDTYYASAAILAKIPPYSEERGSVKSTV